jgi:error-prone DNA polymerase
VLVRQKPGSAKGVLFITMEDETEISNLTVWPSVFERYRRLILSAGLLGVTGKVQREGDVMHVIVEHLVDLTHLLRSVGDRNAAFPHDTGRGDEAKHGGGPDHRDANAALGRNAREIYIPDLRLGSGIKVPTRDFR